jgi:hypothetical protein
MGTCAVSGVPKSTSSDESRSTADHPQLRGEAAEVVGAAFAGERAGEVLLHGAAGEEASRHRGAQLHQQARTATRPEGGRGAGGRPARGCAARATRPRRSRPTPASNKSSGRRSRSGPGLAGHGAAQRAWAHAVGEQGAQQRARAHAHVHVEGVEREPAHRLLERAQHAHLVEPALDHAAGHGQADAAGRASAGHARVRRVPAGLSGVGRAGRGHTGLSAPARRRA